MCMKSVLFQSQIFVSSCVLGFIIAFIWTPRNICLKLRICTSCLYTVLEEN